MDKVIAVTGATGFIGRHLCEGLRATGANVIEMSTRDGDIADSAYFSALPDVDYLFHLAGRTYVPASWEQPVPFYQDNVVGTANALDYCRRNGVPLTVMSSYVYAADAQMPVDESGPVEAANPYGHSKIMTEHLCRYFASTFDMACTIVRPFNVFGPGQDSRFLVPKIVKSALGNDTVTLFDPSPKRDFVYVTDLVRALVLSMVQEQGCSAYNIGSGYSLSVRDVVDTIIAAVGRDVDVRFTGQVRHNEIPDVVADITRMREEFGWTPDVSFQDGVAMIVADLKAKGAGG